MAYVSINLDQEFLDDSYSNSDEMIRRPILPKNLNLKNEMTRYKMKLEEKKRLNKQIKLREKFGYEATRDINTPFKWRSDTEHTEENFVFSNEKILNQGNYVINVQNIKLPGESPSKNFNSTYTYNNSLAYNENIIQKSSSIKGNLFRNTSKSLKFKQSDPFLNFDKKTFKVKYFDKKGYTQENFYPNKIKMNSDKAKESYLGTNVNEDENSANAKIMNNNSNNINMNENAQNINQKEIEMKISSNINSAQDPTNASIKQNLIPNRDSVMSAKNYNPKSLVEFTYHHRVKTPSTIYNVLNKRKKEFFENIKTQNKKNSTLEPTKELLFQKKNFLKTNNITSLLEQKRKDFIPYVFPVAWIHPYSYSNISEKNRYEKITDLLLKLRVYLNENQENELIIAKEFLIRHGIYDKEYLTIDKLSNFIYFIKSDDCLRINPSRVLKDIILDACRYNSYFEGNEDQINSEHNNIYNLNQEIVNSENNNFNQYANNVNSNIDMNASPNEQSPNMLNSSNRIFDANNTNSNSPQHKNIINNSNNLHNNELIKSANNFFTQNGTNHLKNFLDYANFQAMSQNDLISSYNPKVKPSTSQSLKLRNFGLNVEKGPQTQFKIEERTNASMHPILNEKIYKIEFSNPKAVIDNLEPEIARIKGLSINKSQKKVTQKSYERAINNMKKSKRKLNEEINNTVGQLPLKDIEQIKKKNKLLEYIILQRSKNRLKLENDKKVFELEYTGNTVNTNEINSKGNVKEKKGLKVKDTLNAKLNLNSVNKLRQNIEQPDSKNSFFPNVMTFKNVVK